MTRRRRITMGMATLCAVGTFPSVWGSFALGPQLRLHQLSKGWRRWAHFQGRSHSVVLCHTGARTLRRTIIPSCLFAGTDAVLSLGPSSGWREKSATLAARRSPRGGCSATVVDFSGPGRKYWVPSSHVEWHNLVHNRWEALDAA